MHLDQAGVDRPLQQALTQISRKNIGKQGQNIEAHRRYRSGSFGRFARRRASAAAGSAASAGWRRRRARCGRTGRRDCASRARASRCCSRCVPSAAVLLDQHLDLVRRLRADAQPILDPLAVELRPGVGLRDHRIVGAQFFQNAAVARRRFSIAQMRKKGRCLRPNFFMRIRTATRFSS